MNGLRGEVRELCRGACEGEVGLSDSYGCVAGGLTGFKGMCASLARPISLNNRSDHEVRYLSGELSISGMTISFIII